MVRLLSDDLLAWPGRALAGDYCGRPSPTCGGACPAPEPAAGSARQRARGESTGRIVADYAVTPCSSAVGTSARPGPSPARRVHPGGSPCLVCELALATQSTTRTTCIFLTGRAQFASRAFARRGESCATRPGRDRRRGRGVLRAVARPQYARGAAGPDHHLPPGHLRHLRQRGRGRRPGPPDRHPRGRAPLRHRRREARASWAGRPPARVRRPGQAPASAAASAAAASPLRTAPSM